jgi:hypothetical protein
VPSGASNAGELREDGHLATSGALTMVSANILIETGLLGVPRQRMLFRPSLILLAPQSGDQLGTACQYKTLILEESH